MFLSSPPPAYPVLYFVHGGALILPRWYSVSAVDEDAISFYNSGLLECMQRAGALAPASKEEKAGRLRSRDVGKTTTRVSEISLINVNEVSS